MISVDFVIKLSESIEFNIIMMVIDPVSKRAYFVLTHTTVTIKGFTRLFLHYV